MQAMKSTLHEALRHFDDGIDHQQYGRLEEAKAAYQRAIKADKSLAAAYNNRQSTMRRASQSAKESTPF
jgi:hypothetical protein